VSSTDPSPARVAHDRLPPSPSLAVPLENAGDRLGAPRARAPARAPRAHAPEAVALDITIVPVVPALAPLAPPPRVPATARIADARAGGPPPRDACRVTTAPRRAVARIANDATSVSEAIRARETSVERAPREGVRKGRGDA
tara:strand:- start:3799 stop:4224 length:426 start_codon:yes stop_codon:yes gene_type:complete